MSTLAFITINCDAADCGQSFDWPATNSTEARALAATGGWTHREIPWRAIHGRGQYFADLCPIHDHRGTA